MNWIAPIGQAEATWLDNEAQVGIAPEMRQMPHVPASPRTVKSNHPTIIRFIDPNRPIDPENRQNLSDPVPPIVTQPV